MNMEPKPLSKERRDKFNQDFRKIGHKIAWFTKGEMLEVLAAERYWREAVREADPMDLHDARPTPPEYLCRFCYGIGPWENAHKPGCAWVLAGETV